MKLLSVFLLLFAMPSYGQRLVTGTSGAITIPVNESNDFQVIITGNITSVSLATSPATPNGKAITVLFTENSVGGFTVAFGGNLTTTCSITTTAGATTICRWTYNSGGNTWGDFGSTSGGIGYPSGTGIPQVSAGVAWGTTLSTSGSGNVCLTTSCVMTTPNLGTPSAINLTNATSPPTWNQNTTGTASNLSGTPALPNGTTATTQTVGDNTTKIATDAFVLANAGTSVWSALTNPGGNLSLSMAGNTSTFNTTSALSQFFAFKNTTAAVVGTSQGSPILSLCGRAFHSSADVEDCMTLSELPGNGNDAAITFNIAHTGTSTGVVTTQFPGPVAAGTAGSVGGMVSIPEGTAPASLGASTQDNCYADSTAHGILCKFNNGSTLPAVLGPASSTASNLASFTDTSGGKLSDSGVVAANVVTAASNFTSGFLPKAAGANKTLTNSLCDEGITTANVLTCTNSAGFTTTGSAISVGSSPPACTAGTAGALCQKEGTAFTNVASTAGIYPDSTAHEFIAKTNGASTGGILVRAQPGAIHQTAQTAAISTATLCAASAGACNTAGQYHVHWDFIEAGTACGTPGTGGVTFLLTWTDTNATAHSAVSLPMEDSASLTATSGTFTFRTTLAAAWASGDFNISTNGSIIQYATGYTACSVGTGTYQLDAVVTRLQ